MAAINSSTFKDLLLKPELLRAITDIGFKAPTEEQNEYIPHVVLGSDILCEAESGKGKTAIFALGTLQQLDPTDDHVHVLVMCPTRELALQIGKEYERFSKYMTNIRVSTFFGGMPIRSNIYAMNSMRPNVVVGTPGRILALVQSNHMNLLRIDHFVLDECDKMMEQLDMRRDVQEIFYRTARNKQVVMYSSTLTNQTRLICKKFMQDPIELYLNDQEKRMVTGLQHYYVKLTDEEKEKTLIELLGVLEFHKVLVFVNTVERCIHLESSLNMKNIPALGIHSGMPQADRIFRLNKFKSGEERIFIATDVLGRGIDVETVNLVFNYDIPLQCNTYLHRVARAASHGSKAVVISFVSDDYGILEDVQVRFELNINPLPQSTSHSYANRLAVNSNKFVVISNSPLWFKAPFKILRLFVREKLRERVFTVSVPQLSLHVPRESLPIHLGGSLKINHSTWLAHCHKSMTNREDELLANIGQPALPQVSNDYVCEATNQLNNHQDGNQLSEFYSENPPSSASSGFSDDDSLAGAEGDPKTIEQIVDMVRSRGRQGLVQEYAEIRARAPEGTFTNARIRVNLAKNRYTDVLCYDYSRVILSQIDDEPTSDYINANFVDGYKQRNAYISTQGPLPKTTPDFWRMVWEQHCLVIVMTTRVLERRRTKCGQYWETDEGGEWEHGSFRVRTISVESNEEYTVSTLELTNSKTDESRIVSHWQFTSWPDYGVPSSAMAMLNFLQRVREQQAKMVKDMDDTWAGHIRGPPIIVHCSAGIGRTGTFITLDICISRLEDVDTADIRGTVEKISSQRAYSIQMPDQYVFCHLAFIKYALSRGMLQSADLSGFDEREEDSE